VTHHELKTWPGPFAAAKSGQKRHEVRVDDRTYAAGDTVRLREFNPTSGTYSGNALEFTIGHVTRGGEWGIPPGLCVFSLLERP
jgi:hypothetical protein